MAKGSNVKDLSDLNMPVVILLTDATYELINTLSKEHISIELVDDGLSFVWKSPTDYELLTREDYLEKYDYIVEVGTVIYLPREG